MDDEKQDEKHYQGRRKEYRDMVAGGMTDKDASEAVWPTTSAGMKKKADRDKAEEDKKNPPKE